MDTALDTTPALPHTELDAALGEYDESSAVVTSMDGDVVELVCDGYGLAIIGDDAAIDKFLAECELGHGC